MDDIAYPLTIHRQTNTTTINLTSCCLYDWFITKIIIKFLHQPYTYRQICTTKHNDGIIKQNKTNDSLILYNNHTNLSKFVWYHHTQQLISVTVCVNVTHTEQH
jgi:hypothetical protein